MNNNTQTDRSQNQSGKSESLAKKAGKVPEMANGYMDSMREWLDGAPESIEAATDRVLQFMRQRPVTFGVSALGIGILIGMAAFGRRK